MKSLTDIFEGSTLDGYELLEVFSNIIASGFVHQHGGWYLEKAQQLIEEGYINEQGAILISRASWLKKLEVEGGKRGKIQIRGN